MWDWLIVVMIVAAAGLWLGRRWWRTAQGRDLGCGCGCGSGGCSGAPETKSTTLTCGCGCGQGDKRS